MMQLKQKLFCPWMMMLTCGMMKSCLVSGILCHLLFLSLSQVFSRSTVCISRLAVTNNLLLLGVILLEHEGTCVCA